MINNETDWHLIKQVRNDASNEAYLEIARRYQNLFYKVCQRYAAAFSHCGIFLEDIFSQKDILILECIRNFKRKKKTKLSSYIANQTRFFCLNTLNERKNITPSSDSEVQAKIEEKQSYHEYFQNKTDFKDQKEYIFNILGQLKDKRIEEIFRQRYFGKSKKIIWNKIARKLDISPQTAMQLHQKGLTLLKNKLMDENCICDTV